MTITNRYALLALVSMGTACSGGVVSGSGNSSGSGTPIVTTGTSSGPGTTNPDGGTTGGGTTGGGTTGGGTTNPDGGTTGGGTTGGGTTGGGTTTGGSLNGMAIMAADSAWNQDVSSSPVDANSANYLAQMYPSTGMHPDFSNFADGGYGIPYVLVDGSTPMTAMNYIWWPEQSDAGPFPIPLTAPIENGSDQHVIAVDTANHMLYELFTANVANGGWTAGCGAKFDLSKGDGQRPEGWTSADAAGLPIFPGLVRTDEVIDQGVINHALRFTMNHTQAGYVAPATHMASSTTNTNWPPMGLRVRLKASVDISSAGPQAKVILTALKKYGMILADNGSSWYISGAPDARWDDDDLHTMGAIKGSDFEVIQHGAVGNYSP